MRTVLLLLLLSLPAFALTPEELVARNLAARGGVEALRALKSLVLTGTMRYGGGDSSTEMAFKSYCQRGKYRRDATLQGLTAVAAWDGQAAWRLDPFGGRREAERLSADEAKSLQRSAELAGPLLDYARAGCRLDYLGTEDVDGTDAHKLRLTRLDGDVEIIFLDPDYFLEIRVRRATRIRGVLQEEEVDLGCYEKVSGVYFPFSMESGAPGGARTFRILVEKAEANAEVDEQLFSFPQAKGAPGPRGQLPSPAGGRP